jgi:RNA polymerase sigma-70 factor (ECF subfamily)
MEHLGARLAAGDQAAFAELYETSADRLHHYLAVRLGSQQDADDALQETFVRLARNRRKLRSVSNLAAYVFTIARNEANRLAERRKREPAASVGAAAGVLFEEECSDDLSRRETAELVAGAIRSLPPNEREIISEQGTHQC